MANNTVPEVPVINKQEPLVPPLQPGVDHPQLVNVTRQGVAKQLVIPVEQVTPTDEVQQQIAQDGVDVLLGAVGAPAPETNQVTEKQSDKITDFKNNAIAFVPFGNTDREGSAQTAIDIGKEKEEKRAA